MGINRTLIYEGQRKAASSSASCISCNSTQKARDEEYQPTLRAHILKRSVLASYRASQSKLKMVKPLQDLQGIGKTSRSTLVSTNERGFFGMGDRL